jgi:transposase
MSQALIDDAIWARLESLLPRRRPKRGHRHDRTPIPDRAILTGILFVLRSGIPWQMLPRQMGCGSGSTCWRRLVRWQRTGVWQRLHETLLDELRRRGRLDQRWTVIDSGSVRAVRGGKKLDRTQLIAARRAPIQPSPGYTVSDASRFATNAAPTSIKPSSPSAAC